MIKSLESGIADVDRAWSEFTYDRTTGEYLDPTKSSVQDVVDFALWLLGADKQEVANLPLDEAYREYLEKLKKDLDAREAAFEGWMVDIGHGFMDDDAQALGFWRGVNDRLWD